MTLTIWLALTLEMTGRNNNRPKQLHLEFLEPRILYSSDGVWPLPLTAEDEQPETELLIQSVVTNTTIEEAPTNPTQIVIVDPAVENAERLIQQLTESHAQQIQIFILDASQAGLVQLETIISEFEALDAIHILSHGDDGRLQLGNSIIDQQALIENEALLTRLGHLLSDEADILLYGCNLSQTTEGQGFAALLSEFTSADVASSDDLTGHTLLGGDWDLEVTNGQVTTDVIVNEAIQQDYAATFDITTGLVHHYRLDGNTLDSVGAANGTNVSTNTWTAGQIGIARDFAGDLASPYGFIELPPSTTNFGASDFSIGLWMKADSTLGTERLIGDWDGINSGFILYTNVDGTLTFSFSDGTRTQTTTTLTSVFDNTWHHITVLRENSNAHIYVDGINENSDTTGPFPGNIDTADPIRIGASSTVDGNFEGQIDDIRIYTRALTDPDIVELVTTTNSEQLLSTNTTLGPIALSATVSLDAAHLQTTDIDTASTALVYELTSVPSFATIWKDTNANTLGVGDTFTQADIDSSRIFITQNGSSLVTTDSFNFTVDDGIGYSTAATFNLSYAANTEESIVTQTGLSGVSAGAVAKITQSHLETTDAEQTETDITYTIQGVPSLGRLWLGNTQLLDGDQFTQQDINDGLLAYKHDGSTNLSDSTLLSVDDGYGTATFFVFNISLVDNLAPTGITITESNAGLVMNSSGNNQYLAIPGGTDLLGGLTEFTLQMDFTYQAGSGSNPVLFDYATAANNNEIQIYLNSSGMLVANIAGSNATISSSAAAVLKDGNQHSIAMTWESISGEINLYIDGTLERTANIAMGHTLSASGLVSVGVDRIAAGSHGNSNESFKGIWHDVAIFSDIRTSGEIAYSDSDTWSFTTPNLIAHYRFDGFNNQIVTDHAGGYDLHVQTASGSLYTAGSAELSSFLIDENSAVGTVVGQVEGIDPERNALITRLLTQNPGTSYYPEFGAFHTDITNPDTWVNAFNAALATSLNGSNGQLATITSPSQNAAVYEVVLASGAFGAWIGGSDSAVEGEWRWYENGIIADQFAAADGSTVDNQYSNFASTEPNGGVGENYLEIRDTDGQWNDNTGGSTRPYVIEFNATDVLDGSTVGPNEIRTLSYDLISQSSPGAFVIDSATGRITVADATALDYESNPAPTLMVEVTDEADNTTTRSFTVYLRDVDEPVVIVHPINDSTPEDTALDFTIGNGNQITIDAENDDPIWVEFSATNGFVTLDGINPLVATSGSVTAVNATLTNLQFVPDAHFVGSGSIEITVTDRPVTLLDTDAALESYLEFETVNTITATVGPDGIIRGNPDFTTDPMRGDVVSLDGAGDAIEIPSLFGNPAEVTIAGWVNLATGETNAEFASLGDAVGLRLDATSGGVAAHTNDGTNITYNSTGIFLAGTGWRHVALTTNSTTLTQNIYIDGELIRTASIHGPLAYNLGTSTVIGAHADGNGSYDLNGLVDDVRIFSRELNATEIGTLADALPQPEAHVSIPIAVTAVNDAPTISGSISWGITEDDTAPPTRTVAALLGLSFNDIDTGASLAGAAIVNDLTTTEGTWEYSSDGINWFSVGPVSSGSAVVLDATSELRFIPSTNFTGVGPFIELAALDNSYAGAFTSGATIETIDTSINGGTTPISNSTVTAYVNVNAVNDAPTITSATLATVMEDTTNPAGGSISSLFASSFSDPDIGSSFLGIAISANTASAEGIWEYSNDGTNWFSIGPVSESAALVLATTDRLRFLPASDYSGNPPGLELHALDNTHTGSTSTGGINVLLDITNRGDNTPISASTVTLETAVTGVNDAPTIGTAGLPDVAEDSTLHSGDTVANLFGGLFSDVDPGASFAGIAVAANGISLDGSWQYSTDGSTWFGIGSTSGAAALVLDVTTSLRFVPAADFNGFPPSLYLFGLDNTYTGAYTNNGTRVTLDTTVNGGSTPITNTMSFLGLEVTAVNDAPVGGGANVWTTLEDAPSPVSQTISDFLPIHFSDIDSGASLTGAAISSNSDPTEGVWQYSTDGSNWFDIGPVSESASIVLSASTELRFLPDSDFNGLSPTLAIHALDNSYSGAFTSGASKVMIDTSNRGASTAISVSTMANQVAVIAVNDAPTVANAVIPVVAENDTNTTGDIIGNLFNSSFSDPDSGASLTAIAILDNNASTQGIWQYSSDGSSWYDIGSVSLNSALVLSVTDSVRFVPTTNYSGVPPALSIVAIDDSYAGSTSVAASTVFIDVSIAGGTTPFSAVANSLGVTVQGINEAPSISDSALADINEDTLSPVGDTVLNLFASSFVDADTGSSLSGIAISTNTNSTSGSWQYSTDGGANWSAIGSVTVTNALVIESTALLRFLPSANFQGNAPDLGLYALDNTYSGGFTNGTSRIFLDTTVNGDPTAISASESLLGQMVLPVNDAPEWTTTSTSLGSISEDLQNPIGDTVFNLFASLTTDPDSGAGLAGVAIVNDSSSIEGNWQYSTNGVDWLDIGPVSNTSSLILDSNHRLRFLPAMNITGVVPDLELRAIDDSYSGVLTSGNTRVLIDTTTNGNSSALSATTINLNQTIIPINDPPTLGDAALTTVPEDTANPSGSTIASLFAGSFNDPDTGALLSGVLVTANSANTSEGVWQYSNNATDWYDIGTVSSATALVLADSDLIRFLPGPDFNGAPVPLILHALDDTYVGPSTIDTLTIYADLSTLTASHTASTLGATLSVNITAINDAPTIDDVVLPDVTENQLNPAGVNLGSLLSPGYTDVDSGAQLLGIAVVQNSISTEGQWEYSSDNTNWFTIGPRSTTNALVLSSSDFIRFSPAADFAGVVPELSILALDDSYLGSFSSGASEVVMDASVRGGSTALSLMPTTIGITVVPQNAPPTVSLINTTTAISENTVINNPLQVAQIVVTDDNAGTNNLTLTGSDANLFQIVGNALLLQSGVSLDHESANSLSVDVEVDDPAIGTGPESIASLTITISDVNESLSLNAIESTTIDYLENQSASAITSTLLVSDTGTQTLEHATLTIVTGYDAQEDRLLFTDQNGITGLFDQATGTLQLIGTASAADYQQAIRSVTYLNTSESPDTTQRLIEVTVSDGSQASNTVSRTIDVISINDEQVLTNNPTVTIEEGGFITLTAAQLLSTDVDNTDTEIVYTVDTSASNTVLLVEGAPESTFTQQDINDGRVSLQHDSSENNFDQMILTVDDGLGVVTNVTLNISVNPTNDPPEGAPGIVGVGTVGSTLQADTSQIVDQDGISTFSYQWSINDIPIPGATSDSYVIGQGDLGSNIKVAVSYIDGNGNVEVWILSTDTVKVTDNEPTLGSALPDPTDSTDTYSVFEIEALPVPSFENNSTIDSVLTETTVELVDEVVSETTSPSDSPRQTILTSHEEAQLAMNTLLINESVTNINQIDVTDVINSNLQNTPEIKRVAQDEITVEQQLASLLKLDPLELEYNQQEQLDWLVYNKSLANSLEQVAQNARKKLEQSDRHAVFTETLVGISLGFTAGFLVWLLRGGALLASALSVTPLWRQLDPLPIIGDVEARKKAGNSENSTSSEDNTLEQFFERD